MCTFVPPGKLTCPHKKESSFQKEISRNLRKIPFINQCRIVKHTHLFDVEHPEKHCDFCWIKGHVIDILNSGCRCSSCCFHLNLLPTICSSLLSMSLLPTLKLRVFFCLHSWWTFQDPFFWGGPTQQCLESCHILGPAVWSECMCINIYIYILPETNSFYPEK